MVVSAQVCIGAHLRVGVSTLFLNIISREPSLNVRASCPKSSLCAKYVPRLTYLCPHSCLLPQGCSRLFQGGVADVYVQHVISRTCPPMKILLN